MVWIDGKEFPSHVPVDMTATYERWARDWTRWQYVLETFWQRDDQWIIAMLQRAGSLDAAVKLAEAERDGMVAT